MKAIRTIILLLLTFSALMLSAQHTVINGKVQDRQTMSLLPYCNISIVGSNNGCSTDPNGEFTIIPDTLPVYLIISHVGYETQRIWLEKASGNLGLNILLQPSVKLLSEVEVSATREPVVFFKDDEYSVLDYEVQNTLVYLLIYRYRISRSQLICLSDQGDTIGASGLLNFKPTSLFSDCLGYIHVLSEDSACQAFLYKDIILFPYKTSLGRFLSTMSNCVASTDDWLYMREESLDHLTVNFYRINRNTKRKDYLASAADAEKKKILRNNPGDYYYLTMDTLPATPAEIIEYVWVNKILYPANSSALKKIGDTLVVFNTTDGTMNFYSLEGHHLSGLQVPALNKTGEKWTREILFDELTHKAYTTFNKNGKYKLYRIDLSTGKLIYKFTTGHIFPEKLRIDNDYLFYMYHQAGTGENKRLYRQQL